MATWRIISLVAAKLPHNVKLPNNAIRTVSWNSLPCGYQCFTRGLQTVPESTTKSVGINQAHSSNLSSATTEPISVSETNSVNPQLYVSQRHDLAMVFNCKGCGARSVKTVCRESYEKGTVIARCNNCDNLHLISDRLGVCGDEPSSMEEFVAARGEEVAKKSLRTLNLSLEDLTETPKPVSSNDTWTPTHIDYLGKPKVELDDSYKKPDLAMVFNCKACGARSVKTVFKEAYEKGVVIARCNNCDNLHLMSDKLGLCAEPSSMEDLLAARGAEVPKKSLQTFNLKPEDLAGEKDP